MNSSEIKEAILQLTDMQEVREMNKTAYNHLKSLEAAHKKSLKVGDPCVVSGDGDLVMYARITKKNPKTIQIMITDSDSNPEEFRGVRATVNPFQVKVVEPLDSGR